MGEPLRHIALLRGVNVGGHNKLPMADLRASLERAGYVDVATYIQSGNVVLTAARCDGEQISALIKEDFGFEVPVVVRNGPQLEAVIENNPFPEMEQEPKRLHVLFCSSSVPGPAFDAFDHQMYLPDRLRAGPSELYVAYEEGAGSSKLTNAVLDRALGVSTTARNWNTVLKLHEMATG